MQRQQRQEGKELLELLNKKANELVGEVMVYELILAAGTRVELNQPTNQFALQASGGRPSLSGH